jgi:hypothetical protein
MESDVHGNEATVAASGSSPTSSSASDIATPSRRTMHRARLAKHLAVARSKQADECRSRDEYSRRAFMKFDRRDENAMSAGTDGDY